MINFGDFVGGFACYLTEFVKQVTQIAIAQVAKPKWSSEAVIGSYRICLMT